MLYATFYVGDTRYGVPILIVREISRPIKITPVQGSDKRIEGLLNLRGQIVTVLNLGMCLDKGLSEPSNDNRLIILKADKELTAEALGQQIHMAPDTVALQVERVGEVIEAEGNDVEPVPAHISHPYLEGVVKLDGEILVLLSGERISRLQSSGSETKV